MGKNVEQIAALAGKHMAACFNNCGVTVNELKPFQLVITFNSGTAIVEVQDREGEHNRVVRVELDVPNMV